MCGFGFKRQPFESAESALENCNDISEGVLSDTLKVFLEANLPSVKKIKDSIFVLGVVRCGGVPLIVRRSTAESARPFRMR